MGTSVSRESANSNDVIRQLPTLDPLRQQPVRQPQQSASIPVPIQQEKPQRRQKQEEIPWPLPPNEADETFEPKWPTDKERFSVKRAYDLKGSPSNKKFKVAEGTQIKNASHQKETSSSHWNKPNTSIHDSAHVQSSLHTQTHACINLSTTEEINQLYGSLSEVHTQLDLYVEQRQKMISDITKDIIDIITSDTRSIQQDLLILGKTNQMRQDELYRLWLQKYISELDNWKSARLAHLQARMEKYQETIMTYSRQLIMQVNIEANTLKEEILKTAQKEASLKIQHLIEQIQAMSVHHLGTETMTKINLIIHGNVGNKMPGQGCTFDFEKRDKSDTGKGPGIGGKQPTKKYLQKPKQPISGTQVNSQSKSGNHQYEQEGTAFEQRKQIPERQDMDYVEDYQDEDEQ